MVLFYKGDPAAVTLPLHSTPMDEASDVRGSVGMQFVTPVIGNPPHAAGQTLPSHTADARSLHFTMVVPGYTIVYYGTTMV